MAVRRKATKARKAVRAKRKAPSTKQALKSKVQKRFQARLANARKLARELEAQGLSPDEIAARVKAEIAEIGADVLRLAGGSIHVNF